MTHGPLALDIQAKFMILSECPNIILLIIIYGESTKIGPVKNLKNF